MRRLEVATVDECLKAIPAEQRAALAKLRTTIKTAAPDATERAGLNGPNEDDGRHRALARTASHPDERQEKRRREFCVDQ